MKHADFAVGLDNKYSSNRSSYLPGFSRRSVSRDADMCGPVPLKSVNERA